MLNNMKNVEEILKYFPNQIYALVKNTLLQKSNLENDLQEIRIRIGRPILLKTMNADFIIDYKVNTTEILQTVEKLCENSIYAYRNQMCEGFLTIRGGHRVGITGTAVIDMDKVTNLKYITSLNFRIAREVIGCSNYLMKDIIDLKNDTIYNTLIVSPPGKGKTTVLRDIIRNISNGLNIGTDGQSFKGKT